MSHKLEPLELYLKEIYPDLSISLHPSKIKLLDINHPISTIDYLDSLYCEYIKGPLTLGGIFNFDADSAGSDTLAILIGYGIYQLSYIICDHPPAKMNFVLAYNANTDDEFCKLYEKMINLRAFL